MKRQPTPPTPHPDIVTGSAWWPPAPIPPVAGDTALDLGTRRCVRSGSYWRALRRSTKWKYGDA